MCPPCKPIRAAARASRKAGHTIREAPPLRALRARADEQRLIREERETLRAGTARALDIVHDQLWQAWDEVHDDKERGKTHDA